MPLFDTHAHYNDDAFDQDREELLDALPAAGVGAVVIPGVDEMCIRDSLLEFPGKSFIDLPGMPLPTQTWNRESIFSAGGRMPFPFR